MCTVDLGGSWPGLPVAYIRNLPSPRVVEAWSKESVSHAFLPVRGEQGESRVCVWAPCALDQVTGHTPPDSPQRHVHSSGHHPRAVAAERHAEHRCRVALQGAHARPPAKVPHPVAWRVVEQARGSVWLGGDQPSSQPSSSCTAWPQQAHSRV